MHESKTLLFVIRPQIHCTNSRSAGSHV